MGVKTVLGRKGREKLFVGIEWAQNWCKKYECIQAEGMWQDGKPKNWYYAIPIIVIWLIIIGLILKAVS